MREAAWGAFCPPPTILSFPLHSSGTLLASLLWPCYALLWSCFTRGPSRLFKLTKSQGTPGILRPCCTCTDFPCCAQEGTHSFFFYGAHSSIKSLSPSSPRTHILVTATSFPVALQKIILTHLFSFKTLPWRSFVHLVALTTSHFHVFLLWLPLLYTFRINAVLLAERVFFMDYLQLEHHLSCYWDVLLLCH